MATLTIRKLDDEVKRRLRIQAAEHGRSMEEEARVILSQAVGTAQEQHEEGLADAIRKRFAPLGGVELKIPPRDVADREPPRFDE
jgi:antitoxin FitA